MVQRYPIPAKTVRTEITIKRSRFIATMGFAGTVEAARGFIRQIRAEMPDAAHHVYAFRVGYGSSVNEGLSDDGEPAGTSGKPVMSVLRGAELGDIVIVVTRYFGGTKLGTGGLVRAYCNAAKEALDILPRLEKVTTVLLKTTLAYTQYNQFERILPDYGVHILEKIFAENVTLHLSIPEDVLDAFSEHVCEFSVGNATPKRRD